MSSFCLAKATKNYYKKMIEANIDSSDINQAVLEQHFMRAGLYNPYEDDFAE